MILNNWKEEVAVAIGIGLLFLLSIHIIGKLI